MPDLTQISGHCAGLFKADCKSLVCCHEAPLAELVPFTETRQTWALVLPMMSRLNRPINRQVFCDAICFINPLKNINCASMVKLTKN